MSVVKTARLRRAATAQIRRSVFEPPNSPGATAIEEPGSLDKIHRFDGDGGEGGKVAFEPVELGLLADSREHVLPDGADDFKPVLQHKAAKLGCCVVC